ncbi:hypothetical protein P3W55_21035 [Pseudomonas citronellolis]|uniref:Uncharacterized protein n=1 Tax=Pseudomonas citronellolis TaxID=53408 RepID=A0AAW6PD03_9PSED|nr:hypothetical protein [Pseudomonas citronellolis]MDF3844203.1 hypothetical protein [Pseudomonas citronellolis]
MLHNVYELDLRPLLAERLGYGIEHSLLLRDDAGRNQALQALVEDLCAVHGVSLP